MIAQYFDTLKAAIDGINQKEIVALAQGIRTVGETGGVIYVLGNGGSSAMASHMACDLAKGASYQQPLRYNAFALSDSNSTLMAYANDVSFEDAMTEQLKNGLKGKDMVIAISGSGSSKNLVKAIEYAQRVGATTAAITGYPTAKLKDMVDYPVDLNIHHMQIAEDLHLIVNHNLVNLLIDMNEKN